MEKEAEQEQEPGTEMVNISSVMFNSNHSAILAHLKMPSNKGIITVAYNVDMGSDGNIMSFHIYKKLFPSTVIDQLAAAKMQQLS